MVWAEDAVHINEMRNAYNNEAGKPKKKMPLGRYRRTLGIILSRI
jgi:hypothetical protein